MWPEITQGRGHHAFLRGDRWVPRPLGKKLPLGTLMSGSRWPSCPLVSDALRVTGSPRAEASSGSGRGVCRPQRERLRTDVPTNWTGRAGPPRGQAGPCRLQPRSNQLDTHMPACSGTRGAGDSRPLGPAALGATSASACHAVWPPTASLTHSALRFLICKIILKKTPCAPRSCGEDRMSQGPAQWPTLP